MVSGRYRIGCVKKGVVIEATYIVIQAPMGSRSQINRLGNLPIMSVNGDSVPLAELGRFIKETEDPIIYHKDLRAVEYVTGEMEGRLGAPIYGMFAIEDLLENYVTPDGVTMTGMPMGLIGPPEDSYSSGFEWGGEWTVTYETFRDMGGAFIAAMILIYGLIVWEFKNFTLGGLIMAPIPLTLIGIIPGHWITSSEFTATSMIGFIALAGIVVRNSILLVEFVKQEVVDGVEIKEAVITAGKIRMRPILITALTLMAGAYMILDDLIFRGMAVSLLYGAGVATVLTLVVIPLGCISVSKQFYILAGITEDKIPSNAEDSCERSTFSWKSMWNQMICLLRSLLTMIKAFINKYFSAKKNDPDDSGPASPGNNSGPSGSTPPVTPSSGDAAVMSHSLMVQQKKQVVKTSDSKNVQDIEIESGKEKPVARKKSAPRKKVSVKKKAVVKKEITDKTAVAESKENKKKTAKKTVKKAVKKKATTKKKRRGIRLNPGLDSE